MSEPPRLPPKKEVALALLQGPSLMVHLDPRVTDVCVPDGFKKQAQLVLQLGLNLPVPIPDLDVGDEGISCTLSFNRQPFWCFLPWAAIYALVGEDGRGMVWPESAPAELAVQSNRPSLKAVPGQGGGRKRQRDPGASQPPVAPGSTGLAAGAELEVVDGPDGDFEDGEDGVPMSVGRASERPAALHAVPDRSRVADFAEAAQRAKSVATEPAAGNAAEALVESTAATDGDTDEKTTETGADETGADQALADKGKRKLPPYLRVIK